LRSRAYCVAQGWALADVVTDDGISGGKRERLVRLEAQVRAHKAGVVAVCQLDRFARDVAAMLDAASLPAGAPCPAGRRSGTVLP
jgi:DNA invertase Pin-like site-specific DNA recombinase